MSAARKLTEYLREICPQSEMNLARGETVSAHSIREMAALHTYLSGGSETHAVQRGLWKTEPPERAGVVVTGVGAS